MVAKNATAIEVLVAKGKFSRKCDRIGRSFEPWDFQFQNDSKSQFIEGRLALNLFCCCRFQNRTVSLILERKVLC